MVLFLALQIRRYAAYENNRSGIFHTVNHFGGRNLTTNTHVELQQSLTRSLHVLDFNIIIFPCRGIQSVFTLFAGMLAPVINDLLAVHIYTVTIISFNHQIIFSTLRRTESTFVHRREVLQVHSCRKHGIPSVVLVNRSG